MTHDERHPPNERSGEPGSDWQMSRRDLATMLAGLGAGLLVGCKLRQSSASDVAAAESYQALNAFIHISSGGEIHLYLPRVEMGQGTLTSLSTLVAEELGVPPETIVAMHAPADNAYINTALPKIGTAGAVGLGLQMTGGSSTIAGTYLPLRQVAAAAREMLVTAAIQTRGGASDEWIIDGKSMVKINNRAQTLALGAVAEAAAALPVPKAPRLRDPSIFRYIGKSVRRLDAQDKITGKAVYGIDVKIDGMVNATVVHSPALGGQLAHFSDAPGKSVPGVLAVFAIPQGLAIVAEHFWQALKAYQIYAQARDPSVISWASGPSRSNNSAASFDSDQLATDQFFTNNQSSFKNLITLGSTDKAWDASNRRLLSFYYTPFLPHATMEPMNCTVDLRSDHCEIWVPTQFPSGAQEVAHKVSGLPLAQIKINTTMIGGGFGRRLYQDFVAEAVAIAKEMKKPVKLTWTRAEDMQHDFYRPASGHRMRAGVDVAGNPTCWEHHGATQSLYVQFIDDWVRDVLPGMTPDLVKAMAGRTSTSLYQNGVISDEFSSEGADTLPYDLPCLDVSFRQLETPVRVGFWRSVGHSNTAFVVESFIDELADLAGRNPLELRRTLLMRSPRNLAVLNLAAEKAGYLSPAPAGIFRGIAQHHCFGSYCAHVLELRMEGGRPKVTRVVSAVDCGLVVNPDIVKAQVESSVIFGLSAALKQQITFKNGRVQQSNFHDCDILRIYEAPAIEVYIVPSSAPPTGIGEPAVPPVAPALCNAIFAATKRRIKKLPIPETLA